MCTSLRRQFKLSYNQIIFVGKDVATALGYTNTLKAIRDHVDSEDKGVNEMVTPGGTQKVIFINESGLIWEVCLTCRLSCGFLDCRGYGEVTTSMSPYPMRSPAARRSASNLSMRPFVAGKVMVCQMGLLTMLENSPLPSFSQ